MSKEDFIVLSGQIIRIISPTEFEVSSQIDGSRMNRDVSKKIVFSATLSSKIPSRRRNFVVGDQVLARVSISDVKKGIITGTPKRVPK